MSEEIKILEAFSIKIDGKLVLTNNLELIKEKDKDENKPKIPINIKDIEGLQYLEE